MTRVLAIASGKGGVGKTWFSISFAHALARMNRRVLLVDCDVGLANVDVQLGLTSAANLHHVFVGKIPMSRAIQSVDPLGLDIIAGRSGTGHLSGLDAPMVGLIEAEVRRLGDRYDMIILDLPSGLDRGILDLMRCADDGIIVTTGEPTALTDAYALIKAALRDWIDDRPKIVCNFAESEAAGRQTVEGFGRVCDRFLRVEPCGLGVIRRDARVPEAVSRQCALLNCYPGSHAARDVVATAEAFLAAIDQS